MDEWENKKVHGYHISRYIASWQKAGGNVFDYRFKQWLYLVQPDGTFLDDDEVHEILFVAQTGKMEFEESASDYLKKRLYQGKHLAK